MWYFFDSFLRPKDIVQDDKKLSVHLIFTIQKVARNVQSVPRHSRDIYWHAELFSRRPCSVYYVIMISDWNCLKYFCIFCTVIIRCTETSTTLPYTWTPEADVAFSFKRSWFTRSFPPPQQCNEWSDVVPDGRVLELVGIGRIMLQFCM
jgi:hypothetical protein